MDFSLFQPKLSSMQVHSATCSCSVELYKQWWIFRQTGTFRGVFSISNNAVRISAAAMGGSGDIILIKKE
jgi:hypothetical protein